MSSVCRSFNVWCFHPEKWPDWVQEARKLSKPNHRGIGDTIEQEIGTVNSVAVREWFKRITGRELGQMPCPSKLNKMYPNA